MPRFVFVGICSGSVGVVGRVSVVVVLGGLGDGEGDSVGSLRFAPILSVVGVARLFLLLLLPTKLLAWRSSFLLSSSVEEGGEEEEVPMGCWAWVCRETRKDLGDIIVSKLLPSSPSP